MYLLDSFIADHIIKKKKSEEKEEREKGGQCFHVEAQQSISIFWRHWLFVPRAAPPQNPNDRHEINYEIIEEVRDELIAEGSMYVVYSWIQQI